MISVLRDDHACIGFLRSTAKGFTAHDADGKSLGLFERKDAAVEAIIYAAASTH